jgi:SNF2 family DNA or RNA helicase
LGIVILTISYTIFVTKNRQTDKTDKTTLKMTSQILTNAGYTMYPHQVKGVEFLVNIENNFTKGGILADEVGLGKTIQTIALLLERPGHTLIAGPLAVVPQWEEKLKSILPEDRFTVVVHHGKTRLTNIGDFLDAQTQMGKTGILVTSHGLMTRKGAIHAAKWDRFVLDEAHYARNPKTQLFKRCTNLKATTKWMLSATPVQNKSEDLMSLLRIACNLNGWTGKLEKIKKLRDVFLLRRTKEEIKQPLPPLTIENKLCRFLEDAEEQFYSKVEQSTTEAFNQAMKRGNTDRMIVILELLLRLRQCTLHPQMVIDGYKKKGIFNQELPEWDTKTTKIYHLEKIIKKELVESPDQRTIIFCQFHKEIELVQEMLTENGFTSEVYSGKTDQETRVDIITGILRPQFLIIQIRAGGAGLNLQAYHRVFITSPDWNPSNEFQAIGRAHRNGQTKPVKVTRLILHWSKKYMTQLKEYEKIAKIIEDKLKKDEAERKLSVNERFELEEKLASMKKKKPNTIDYRIFMVQKAKTEIQADVLDDAFLTKIHKYDTQDMENSATLSSSNYKYLLG